MKRNKDQWAGEFDFSDPQVLKNALKEQFEDYRRLRSSYGGLAPEADLDVKRLVRRQETALRTVYYAKEMVGEDYPDYPGTSYFEQDWAYLSANVFEGYDAIDNRSDLILAAAIWILDTLNLDHYMFKVEQELLPEISEEEAMDIPSWMTGRDAVYSDELLMKTVYILIHRNDDCKVYTAKGEMKRNFLDEATVRSRNRQDVPSRQRFEKLIEALDPSEVESAVAEFREKYWFLARAYFAGLRKNHARRDELIRQHDRLTGKLKQYTKNDRTARIALNPDFTPAQSLKEQLSQNFQNVAALNQAVERCADLVEEGCNDKMNYTDFFGGYLSMTPEFRQNFMTEELNERMKDFRIENPYRLAFALLYLADRNDDLIWMYYFGTTLAYMTADSLPWKHPYDDYDAELLLKKHAHEEVKNRFPDFYEMRYSDPEDDDPCGDSFSLAQLMFGLTGVILPRNLDRFDCLESSWDAMGIPADAQKMMRLAMCFMEETEGRYGGHFKEPEDTEAKEESSHNEEELKAQIASLKKQVSTLAAENKQLKNTSWKAQKENAQLNEKLAEMHRNMKADKDELAGLRELIFLSQNPETETENPGIALPYETRERIVICGGHPAFINQIRQFITGNVRCFSNVRISEDMIRNAGCVWIQTNAISHSDYYKITDLCRKYEIPMYYFLYASARKCAEQIVETERKRM